MTKKVTDEGDKKNEIGEPTKYDPTFKGPLKNRSCTDIICLILFLICFLAMIIVAAWAYYHGEPSRLLYPTDSNGNICGTGDFQNKPYLVFFDMTECAKLGLAVISGGCPTPQVCVAECPKSNWGYLQELPDTYISPISSTSINTSALFCTYDVDFATTTSVCVSKCPSKLWTFAGEGLNAKTRPLSSTNINRSALICRENVNLETTASICASECPKQNWTFFMEADFDRRPISSTSIKHKNLICKQSVDLNTTTRSLADLVSDEKCAPYYLASKPLVGRCVPEFITKIVDEVLKINGTEVKDKIGRAVNGTQLADTKWLKVLLNVQSYGEKILADVRASWWLILIFLGIGAIVAFVWILLMRCLACPIVWFTLFAFLGLFTFSTYYCFTKYVELKSATNETIEFSDLKLTTDLDYWANLYYTWLALGIISAVFLGIVVIIVLFLRERICIAIRLIEESSRAVGAMIFTLFWPLFPFIFEVAIFAFWGASAIYLASIGERSYGASNVTNTSNGLNVEAVLDTFCDDKANGTVGAICSFIKYGGNQYTIYLQFYQLFMLFWCMNFVIAVGQMTLAGAFASYYWAWEKPRDIPTFPLLASLWRVFRYHLGSVAFGSLIIAIIQLIRVILEYIDHKLKGKENKFVKFLLCCLKCCFWCLEKVMKFINKNAYILIAIYGKNFCVSAKNAFFLIMRNIVRVVVIDKVTDFLLFIGKLVVVAAVTILAFFFFSRDMEKYFPMTSVTAYIANYNPSLNYYLLPVIIILIGVYIIAAAFFSVYNMAVDTLFLCFLEDLERHDGSAEKPYYMSKGLMKILGKKNVKGGEDEKRQGCCGCCC